jgi:HSP20 family protein
MFWNGSIDTRPRAGLRAFRDMDRLFSELEGFAWNASEALVERGPALTEEDGAFVLVLEVPGAGEGDVDVQVHERVLTVTVSRKDAAPEGYRQLRREREPLRLRHTLALPPRVDVEKIGAKLENGVLTVTLPKVQAREPRKITVTVGG